MIKKQYSSMTQKSGNDNTQQNVVINRTVEGTVFEIIAAVAIVAMWICVAFTIAKSGGKAIPTHFDFAGNPDSYGSPYWLLLVGGVGTAIGVFYLLAAYHPTTWISTTFPVRTPRQVKNTTRWARIMAVEVPILCIIITLSGMEMMGPLFKAMIFIMIATCMAGAAIIRFAK